MDITGSLVVLGFLLFFGFVVYLAVTTSRKEKEKRAQVAAALGFSPLEDVFALAAKIFPLYRRSWSSNKFELRNVFRKTIPDGEMFLFDLMDTSGEDDSITEQQAVAILSPYLKLPQFAFFPKADSKYALSGIANKVVEWGMSKMGTVIAFPEYPEFSARYVVTSEDDPSLARGFFDERLVLYFSRTQMYMLRGAGDLFAFAEMDTKFKAGEQENVNRKINRAMEIFRVLQK
jgi:hypothetical protein